MRAVPASSAAVVLRQTNSREPTAKTWLSAARQSRAASLQEQVLILGSFLITCLDFYYNKHRNPILIMKPTAPPCRR